MTEQEPRDVGFDEIVIKPDSITMKYKGLVQVLRGLELQSYSLSLPSSLHEEKPVKLEIEWEKEDAPDIRKVILKSTR